MPSSPSRRIVAAHAGAKRPSCRRRRRCRMSRRSARSSPMCDAPRRAQTRRRPCLRAPRRRHRRLSAPLLPVVGQTPARRLVPRSASSSTRSACCRCVRPRCARACECARCSDRAVRGSVTWTALLHAPPRAEAPVVAGVCARAFPKAGRPRRANRRRTRRCRRSLLARARRGRLRADAPMRSPRRQPLPASRVQRRRSRACAAGCSGSASSAWRSYATSAWRSCCRRTRHLRALRRSPHQRMPVLWRCRQRLAARMRRWCPMARQRRVRETWQAARPASRLLCRCLHRPRVAR